MTRDQGKDQAHPATRAALAAIAPILARIQRTTSMKRVFRARPAPANRSESKSPGEVAEAAGNARAQGRRESIESFVVVLLGFLVWSFDAEGFVIPTGSMAPTLMGRHKEMTCPECGWVYRVNADSEVDPNGLGARTGQRVTWGTCENCRFEARVDAEPSFSGDRVYTVKTGTSIPLAPFAGRVEPRRWEVTVFKLPEDPSTRYIKRLVGMPGEVLRVQQGDLWRRDLDLASQFERARRSPAQQLQTRVPVFDDSHRPASLRDDPRWRRWTPSASWTETESGAFEVNAKGDRWEELRYRHVVPDPEQWAAIREGREPDAPPRATLITDFSSYNTDQTPQGLEDYRSSSRPWFQPHWVGDLTLSLTLDVAEPQGLARLELIEAGISNRCEIDLTTGEARLFRGETQLGEPAATSIGVKGRHKLVFANVDDRLTLWVDGGLPFGDGRDYAANDAETISRPTDDDLEPARVAARGARFIARGLVLERDVYYTQEPGEPDSDDLLGYVGGPPGAFFDLLADPARYGELTWRAPRDYPIEPGRYMMLGDNSAWSRDGRAWGRPDQTTPTAPDRGWDDSGRESWEVPEPLVTGRAFCVYWPHFKPVWPKIPIGPDLRLPARPNLEEARWIR